MKGDFVRDKILLGCLRFATAVAAGVIFLIICFVFFEAWTTLADNSSRQSLFGKQWNPTEGKLGLGPMVVGTLAAAILSMLITIPLGIGSALFGRFYAPTWLAFTYRRIVELLAGIPSVVFGLWGITAIVPLIANYNPLGQGQSLLAGALVLSAMTLPTISLAIDSALGSVPYTQVQAAAALGLGKRAVIWSVMIPSAKRGILVGVILQLGRALGETMAVLMVCGNIAQIPDGLLVPVRTLTASIALEMGYADEQHRSALFLCGLILLLITGTLMLLINLINRSERISSTRRVA